MTLRSSDSLGVGNWPGLPLDDELTTLTNNYYQPRHLHDGILHGNILDHSILAIGALYFNQPIVHYYYHHIIADPLQQQAEGGEPFTTVA